MKLQYPIRNVLFILLLMVAVTTALGQRTTASENVSTFILRSPQLNVDKKIWVYLPHNYSTEKKKYPVIYMHDAQNLFDKNTSYSGEWEIDETLDSIKAQVIVVAIEHGNEKRIDELTPYKNQKHGGGNGDAYLDFLVKTLKPHIDKTYRTKSNKNNTTIFGSSLGGLISYYALLKYPEVFGKAGVFSPSLWFSDDIYKLTEQTKKLKAKIYLLAGDSESSEMVSDVNKLEKLIDQKRCSCLKLNKKVIVKGGQHNEKLWREQFLNAYLWLD